MQMCDWCYETHSCHLEALVEETGMEPPLVSLRPYQNECVDRVFEELEANKSTLVVMPTGTGKTILFAEVIRRWAGFSS